MAFIGEIIFGHVHNCEMYLIAVVAGIHLFFLLSEQNVIGEKGFTGTRAHFFFSFQRALEITWKHRLHWYCCIR